MRKYNTVTLSGVLSACAIVAVTSLASSASIKHVAPKMKSMHKAMAKGPVGSWVVMGKKLAQADGCNTCHATNYSGKHGFSPSIRASGITHKYNATTFARMLDIGKTEDGGHVSKPMPVYHMSAAKGKAIYAFLKTQK